MRICQCVNGTVALCPQLLSQLMAISLISCLLLSSLSLALIQSRLTTCKCNSLMISILFSFRSFSLIFFFFFFRVRVEYYVNENTLKERLQLYFIKNQRSSKYRMHGVLWAGYVECNSHKSNFLSSQFSLRFARSTNSNRKSIFQIINMCIVYYTSRNRFRSDLCALVSLATKMFPIDSSLTLFPFWLSPLRSFHIDFPWEQLWMHSRK